MGTLLYRSPADALLEFGNRLFPLHSAALRQSSVLDSLQCRPEGPGGKRVLKLDSSQLASLQRLVGPGLTPLNVERFLSALSGGALEKSCSEVRI